MSPLPILSYYRVCCSRIYVCIPARCFPPLGFFRSRRHIFPDCSHHQYHRRWIIVPSFYPFDFGHFLGLVDRKLRLPPHRWYRPFLSVGMLSLLVVYFPRHSSRAISVLFPIQLAEAHCAAGTPVSFEMANDNFANCAHRGRIVCIRFESFGSMPLHLLTVLLLPLHGCSCCTYIWHSATKIHHSQVCIGAFPA